MSRSGICHSAYCMLMTQGSFSCKQPLIYGQSVNSCGQQGRPGLEGAGSGWGPDFRINFFFYKETQSKKEKGGISLLFLSSTPLPHHATLL